MEKKKLIRLAVVVCFIALPFCALPFMYSGLAYLIGAILILLPILALAGKLKYSVAGLFTPGRQPGTGLRLLEIVAGIVLIVTTGAASSWKAERQMAADKQAQADTVKKAREASILRLQQNLGSVALECRARIESAKAALEKGSYDQAEENLVQVWLRIDPYLKSSPVPSEIVSVRETYERLTAEVTPKVKARAAWNEAQQAIKDGEDSIRERKFSEARTFFVTAQDRLGAVGESEAQALGLSLSRTVALVDSKLKLLKKPAEREEAALEKAENERKLLAYVCGDKPERSSWDGAIIGLESNLKEFAHDPKSIDVSDCSEPVMSDKHCWTFRCKVRGKNAFGALILKTPLYAKNRLGFSEIK